MTPSSIPISLPAPSSFATTSCLSARGLSSLPRSTGHGGQFHGLPFDMGPPPPRQTKTLASMRERLRAKRLMKEAERQRLGLTQLGIGSGCLGVGSGSSLPGSQTPMPASGDCPGYFMHTNQTASVSTASSPGSASIFPTANGASNSGVGGGSVLSSGQIFTQTLFTSTSGAGLQIESGGYCPLSDSHEASGSSTPRHQQASPAPGSFHPGLPTPSLISPLPGRA
ncbi:unnamed protein product, partial [Protopolystoma xenopodis]